MYKSRRSATASACRFRTTPSKVSSTHVLTQNFPATEEGFLQANNTLKREFECTGAGVEYSVQVFRVKREPVEKWQWIHKAVGFDMPRATCFITSNRHTEDEAKLMYGPLLVGRLHGSREKS